VIFPDPAEGTNGLQRIPLPFSVQYFYGNDMSMRHDAAINAVGKDAVSAGDTRDMAHGCEI